MSKYLIKGASLYGEKVADILIEDGVISRIAENIDAADAQVVEAAGQVALPGLVDIHTHLRQPGYEASETVETGTRAAALGGYTAVFAMANSMPVADTAAVVEQVDRLGKESAWCRVQPIGAVTVGLKGERLSDIGGMANSTANVRVFSDDGMCVYDPAVMRRALEYVKTFDGVIAQHAQEPRLTEGAQMNEGKVSADLGLAGWPAVAEEAIIARDVLLAEHLNSKLHICHLSTKGSIEVVRWAKSRGVKVTAEATPHHLLLTDETARTYDPVFKVNPPLRTEEDVLALRQAVADGIIDVIGTDHAPHPAETKECEWACAANGMTGLEQALSIIQMTLVDTGMITWRDVARILSEQPAKIGRLDHEQGRPLAEGEPANIVLVDPKATRVIKPEEQATKGKNNPYRGMEVPGSIRATFYAGHPTVLNGKLATPRK